jgi:hypothetical protein
MSAAALAILEQAKQLPDAECEIVLRGLDEHLHADASDELPDEMKQTLDRRWEEIVSGKVKCIPHAELMQELQLAYAL